MNFNDSQRTAISHKEGPCLVVAGPGSGKTAVITHRINELIRSGIPAEKVLVITFTKAAALEMKERFNRLSDTENLVTFGTFHSLFWGILQKELHYKNSDIVMGKQREIIIKEAIRISNLDDEDISFVNAVSSDISAYENHFNNSSFEAQVLDDESFELVIENYKNLKKKYRVLDFDDMLVLAHQLLKNKPQVLDKWQRRFDYFLVDEMQDMNDLQFELIKLLSRRTNNVFFVGDDDQSIYGFRGANPKIMSDFMDYYKGACKIILNHNYRNPKNIVDAATRLIRNNQERVDKDIISANSEGKISIFFSENEREEAEVICSLIMKRIEEGGSYDDFSILYRNHSDAKYVITKLLEQNIPIYLKESVNNIFSHFIIEDIEAYFQIAIGNSTRERLLKIINRPNRYIHRASVENGRDLAGIQRFYSNNEMAFRRVEALIKDIILISKMTPVAAINYIRKIVGYESYLQEEAIKQGVEQDEYTEVLSFITESVRDCKTIKQAINKINMLRYKVDFETKNKEISRVGKVGLYTLHSSKGLEFDNVFIIGANEGVLPSNKCDTKEEIEAERRLFYVGVTRCKKELYISYLNKKNRDKSRFIDEMKIDYSSASSA